MKLALIITEKTTTKKGQPPVTTISVKSHTGRINSLKAINMAAQAIEMLSEDHSSLETKSDTDGNG